MLMRYCRYGTKNVGNIYSCLAYAGVFDPERVIASTENSAHADRVLVLEKTPIVKNSKWNDFAFYIASPRSKKPKGDSEPLLLRARHQSIICLSCSHHSLRRLSCISSRNAQCETFVFRSASTQ